MHSFICIDDSFNVPQMMAGVVRVIPRDVIGALSSTIKMVQFCARDKCRAN